MHSDTSYTKGLFAEFIARMYLRLHGYSKDTLAFIEVKNRKTVQNAWDAITARQAVRLRRAAETYIAQNKWTGNARFDVIFVCGHRVHWIKNAI